MKHPYSFFALNFYFYFIYSLSCGTVTASVPGSDPKSWLDKASFFRPTGCQSQLHFIINIVRLPPSRGVDSGGCLSLINIYGLKQGFTG